MIYDGLQSDEERIAFADQVLKDAFILSQRQAMYFMDVNNLQKIEKILKKHFDDSFTPEVLVQSLENCVTQSMMLRLNEYARDLDAAEMQSTVDDPAFLDILEEYGHRGNVELDLGTARWRENPAYLLDLTTLYLEDKMYLRNLDDHAVKRREAEAMIEDVYEKLKKKKGERLAARVKRLMINYRYAVAMREYPKSCIVKFMDLGRRALQQIGDRLVKEGKLNQRDDIFFFV